jgi:tetratricopeptide (TPR) repeat protein/anti-sigma regulatory factor (Ser/Thr protein kinase)
MVRSSSLLICSFFLIVHIHGIAYSQTKKDSLHDHLQNAILEKRPDLTANIYKSIAKHCYFDLNQYDSTIYFSRKAIQLNKNLKREIETAYMYKLAGYALVDMEHYSTGLKYLDSALAIYSKQDELLPLIQIYTNKGIAFSFIEDNEKSINAFEKAIDLSIELDDSSQMATNLLNAGIMYNFSGDYPSAIESLTNACSIYEAIGDSTTVVNTYIEIGNVYQNWEKYSTAFNYYDKAVNLKDHIEDDKVMASLFDVMGFTSEKQDSLDKAMDYYKKLLEFSKNIDYRTGMAHGLYRLGNLEFYKENYQSAINYYNRSLDIEIEIGSNQDIVYMEHILAETYLKTEDFHRSLHKLKKAREICFEYSFRKELSKNNQLLYQVYKKTGNADSALKYYENHIALRDSMYSEKQEMLMENLREKYETEKKERTIQQLNNEKQIQQERISRQRQFFIALVLVIFLIIIIAILVGAQQKRKEALRKLQVEQRLFRSQLNPHFIFNALNAIKNVVLKNESHRAADYLIDFSGLMRLILDGSTKDFTTLQEEIDLLKNYIKLHHLRFHGAFSYHFYVDDAIQADEISFPSMLLQPFVENAIEHGIKKGGKQVTLRFLNKENAIKVEIADDGPGINHAENGHARKHQPKAIGITRERIKILNSLYHWKILFHISNSTEGEGQGTQITFLVPWLQNNRPNSRILKVHEPNEHRQ